VIYLITGLPGSGKTLFALAFVQKEFPDREVYYHGIADLKLPWIPMEGGGADWMKVPDRSVVVIDEAQSCFRPRGTGSLVPAHVAALETHRHRGLDIVVITQHPKLLDANLRRLVGAHRHVVRAFGTQGGVVHAWAECCEDADKSRADSIRSQWRYPAELFAAYRSAEVHTHKRRLPGKLFAAILLPVVAVALLAGGVGYAYKYFTAESRIAGSAKTEKGKAREGSYTDSERVRRGPDAAKVPWRAQQENYLESFRPMLAGLPHSAPAYAEVMRPKQAPEPAGCVSNGSRCRCYTQQATLLPEVPEDMCRQIVANGFFRAWADPVRADGSGGQATAKQSGVSDIAAGDSRHTDPEPRSGAPDGPAQVMPQRSYGSALGAAKLPAPPKGTAR